MNPKLMGLIFVFHFLLFMNSSLLNCSLHLFSLFFIRLGDLLEVISSQDLCDQIQAKEEAPDVYLSSSTFSSIINLGGLVAISKSIPPGSRKYTE